MGYEITNGQKLAKITSFHPFTSINTSLFRSEKSAIIPTKNEASNSIEFPAKQNLSTHQMCGKLCYGFSVNGLREGKELFLWIFSFFGNLFVWKISFSSLLTSKIWKFSSPFCSIYGSRNRKKCLYMEIGLYSDMSRSEKNAFIPT